MKLQDCFIGQNVGVYSKTHGVITGKLIESIQNETQITIPSVRTGMYILKINGYGYKIMIKQLICLHNSFKDII